MAGLRDRADVPGSKLAFDVDRIDGSGPSSSDASRLRGSIARRMAAGISLRWGQPRCSRSTAWFEGMIGPLAATRPVDGDGLIERQVIVALRGCEGPAIGTEARWLGMGSGLDVIRA
ncbi:hypothetical protein EA_SCOWL_91 [Mycobacterium phage Scowl]|nr:hypothetical protein EA_SCOWL_91 [Mycobacterium phage Scowl]